MDRTTPVTLTLRASLAAAVHDVARERDDQDAMWGVQNHHPAYWLAIMGKQVGQFGTSVLNREWWEDKDKATLGVMRHEAVQMAAVAVAIIECIDAGEMPEGLVTAKPSDPRLLSKVLGRDDESLHGQEEKVPTKYCYHCDLVIEYDADDAEYHHADEVAYQAWLDTVKDRLRSEHKARWEPLCIHCGRDNANGTHDALQSGGHLNHGYAAGAI
jgi:hypothetical protein